MPRQPSLRRCLDACLILLFAITGWRIWAGSQTALETAATITPITPALKRGDVLRVPDLKWTTPRSVVLVVSSTCPACNANLPFYRELSRLASPLIQIVGVSSEKVATVADWMQTNGIDITSLHQIADPSSHGLTLTPMIVVVDGEGRVTDLMIRKLDQPDQAKVLERLRNSEAMPLDNSQQIREVSVQDVENGRSRGAQVLDVRPRDSFRRGHRSGARNIPSVELGARAPVELELRAPVIVDCLQPGGARCRGAPWTLIEAGFTDVSLLIR